MRVKHEALIMETGRIHMFAPGSLPTPHCDSSSDLSRTNLSIE
jgi:hypothetical protein